MPAVIPLVMMGVSAAAGAYSAHKASNTAKDAAKAQETQANKGMALEEKMWREQQERMKPYLQGGYQALNNLSQQANTPRRALL